MSFSDAIRFVKSDSSSVVLIDLEVTPGAKFSEIPSGYNPWRKRIEVRISEQAQKGKANEQLIEEFSAFFSVPKSSIQVEAGSTSTKKTIGISSVTLEFVEENLKKAFDKKK